MSTVCCTHIHKRICLFWLQYPFQFFVFNFASSFSIQVRKSRQRFTAEFFHYRISNHFLPNLKRLPRPFLRYSLAHRQRRLPFGAALTGYDFKCTFAGSTPFLLLNLLSYFSGKFLPFDTLTFFALASFTITISFSDVPAFFFQSKNERINLIN